MVIKVVATGTGNAVVSGLFFDAPAPAAPGAAATSAVFGKNDTTTQGSWMQAYGAQGYGLVNNGISYPAYAQVAVSGANAYTWAASSTATLSPLRYRSGAKLPALGLSYSRKNPSTSISPSMTSATGS